MVPTYLYVRDNTTHYPPPYIYLYIEAYGYCVSLFSACRSLEAERKPHCTNHMGEKVMDWLYDILALGIFACAGVILIGVLKMIICDFIDDHL